MGRTDRRGSAKIRSVTSLLDVLHGRTSGTPRATQPEPALDDRQAAELLLAPELELAEGSTDAHRRGPPSEDDTLASGFAITEDPADGSNPATTTPVAPSHAQRAPAFGHRPNHRKLLLLLLGTVASVGFATFLAVEFTGQDDDTFLVTASAAPASPPASAQTMAITVEEPEPAAPDRLATAPARSRGANARRVAEPLVRESDLVRDEAPAKARVIDSTPLIKIARGPSEAPLFAKLRDAYAALTTGDADRAETLYREALVLDTASIDALLGLASLAARGGRLDEARDLFGRVQRLDPKNPTALASLTLLPGAAARPNSESQLKILLREQPTSAALYFALGLNYVAQQRWPDAQVAFFEAVRNEPTNADYAFNLAVSLDRLGQVQPAASYYQRAIDLAPGGHRFDLGAARERLAALGAPPA